MNAIKHGLGQLFNFSGRMRAVHFWLYATVVIVSGMVAMGAAIGPVVNDMFARLRRFQIEHPHQVTVMHAPGGGTSWSIEGNHPELMPDLSPFLAAAAIVALITALLLAAAVTRRLHDSDRRGWWGVLPLPFLATGLAIFPLLIAQFGTGQPDLRLFGLLFLNNLIYLGTLGLLVIFLCLSGTRGPNRFGPQPGQSEP